ncbi:Calx-beta domain-containing protein [Saccharothrix yanglingensis]|nr:Calx-beta domain-containing protein [Saccharothrix yanglingensis]
MMRRLVLAMAVMVGVVSPASVVQAAECSPARVAVAEANQYEGTEVADNLTFQVTATADAGCTPSGSVHYRVVGDTADPEQDYVKVTGTVVWTATSSRTQAVSVPMRNDPMPELDERLLLELFDATGLTVTEGTAVGWLRDDDGRVTRSVETTVEGGKICWVPDTCRVRIRFSVPLRAPVTVHYRTRDVTAVAGSDYVKVVDAKVTAQAGATTVLAPVTLLFDQTAEPAEVFELEIFAPTAGRVVGGVAPVTIKSGQ